MEVKCYGISDIGLARLNNEDAYAYLEHERFFVLADGMGGHNAGEVASQLTVKHLCDFIKKARATPLLGPQWKKEVSDAIFETNLKVYETAEQNAELRGMGTTLCLAWLLDHKLLIGHVGDSRIYRFRKNRLTCLTQDHSLKGELIARGELDEHSAKTFAKKNVITRAIGTQMTVDPDLRLVDVASEDLYLLCSDGLSDPLTDSAISALLEEATGLEHAAEELILAAKRAGGGDNITLLAFKITY